MIEIGRTLISDELVEKKFVCDLNACKGACCVPGIPLAIKMRKEFFQEITDLLIGYLVLISQTSIIIKELFLK